MTREFIRLSRQQLSRSRVIARGSGIRDLLRLRRQYGGTASGWLKKSTEVFRYRGRRCEIHWYEHHGLGRFEMRYKWIDEQ